MSMNCSVAAIVKAQQYLGTYYSHPYIPWNLLYPVKDIIYRFKGRQAGYTGLDLIMLNFVRNTSTCTLTHSLTNPVYPGLPPVQITPKTHPGHYQHSQMQSPIRLLLQHVPGRQKQAPSWSSITAPVYSVSSKPAHSIGLRHTLTIFKIGQIPTVQSREEAST